MPVDASHFIVDEPTPVLKLTSYSKRDDATDADWSALVDALKKAAAPDALEHARGNDGVSGLLAGYCATPSSSSLVVAELYESSKAAAARATAQSDLAERAAECADVRADSGDVAARDVNARAASAASGRQVLVVTAYKFGEEYVAAAAALTKELEAQVLGGEVKGVVRFVSSWPLFHTYATAFVFDDKEAAQAYATGRTGASAYNFAERARPLIDGYTPGDVDGEVSLYEHAGPLRASFEDPTPRAYLGKPEVDEYLSQHGIQAWLAEAVNAAVLARSPNPRKFIATWLAERTALG